MTVIGLTRDRCNYSAIIDTFSHTYDIPVNQVDPGATPSDQVRSMRATTGSDMAPDVVDLSMTAAQEAAAAGLLAPFKVSTWDSIPDAVKAADGTWTGNYYRVMSFEVNTTVAPVVPQTWADLRDARYKGQIALAGDPRTLSDGAFAVYAAALANGGSLDDAQKGLDFFKEIHAAGNLLLQVGTAGTLDDGQTPLVMRWTSDSLPHHDASIGRVPTEVVVPPGERLALANVEAISAKAPHPNAARLWLEFLYGDQGQNLFLEGYCHPIRFDDMVARAAIPVETLAKLPETSPVVFPTVAQEAKAIDLITTGWNRAVSADIR